MTEKDRMMDDFFGENEADNGISVEDFPEERPVSDDTIVVGNLPLEAGAEKKPEKTEEKTEKAAPKKKKNAAGKKKKGKKKKGKGKGKKKKNKKLFTGVFIVLLVCFIAVFGWFGYVSAYIYPLLFGSLGGDDSEKAPITEEQQAAFASGQMVVTLLGSDGRDAVQGSRSDTLMVAFVDLDQSQISLLSIPRDTYVTIPTTGERTKINAAYAYGGVELTQATLKENFGITSDYFMDVDFQGFIDIIDAVGGLTIDVPMDMHYLDEGIDLKKGVQTLDGNKSLQFCRFRSDGQGDLGRVDRQQAFLVALKNEMFSAGTLLKIPEICSAVLDNVTTDFSGTQLLQILLKLKDGFDFQTYQPEGDARYQDDISYVFTTENGQKLIDLLVAFEPIPADFEPTTDQIDLSPDGAAPSETETGSEDTTEEE